MQYEQGVIALDEGFRVWEVARIWDHEVMESRQEVADFMQSLRAMSPDRFIARPDDVQTQRCYYPSLMFTEFLIYRDYRMPDNAHAMDFDNGMEEQFRLACP